jgi:hypothetical protein
LGLFISEINELPWSDPPVKYPYSGCSNNNVPLLTFSNITILSTTENTMNKYLMIFLLAAVLQGCSDDKAASALTKEMCDTVGGTIVDGECHTPQGSISPKQMKKNCELQGMEYSEIHNGCIPGPEQMKVLCEEQGMKYSSENNGCFK